MFANESIIEYLQDHIDIFQYVFYLIVNFLTSFCTGECLESIENASIIETLKLEFNENIKTRTEEFGLNRLQQSNTGYRNTCGVTENANKGA